jgi:hypothetical protein
VGRYEVKIAEIVSPVVWPTPEEVPVNSFTQRIANAFTASGRVKRPLEFQNLGSEGTLDLSSSIAASDEATSAAQTPDAVPKSGTTFPTSPVDDLDVEPRSVMAHVGRPFWVYRRDATEFSVTFNENRQQCRYGNAGVALMREHGLQPKRRRRFVITTDSDHNGPIFPNLAGTAVVGQERAVNLRGIL